MGAAYTVTGPLLLHLGLRRSDAGLVDPTLPRVLGRPARTVETYVDDRALWRSDDPSADGAA